MRSWTRIVGMPWLLALTWVLTPTVPSLSLEDRARCMRQVEEVLWQHRLWPRTDVPKPPLSQVVPETFFIRRAQRVVRASNALERFWHRPVRPSDLQQELDRIVRETRDPAILREIWAALGNDPTRAAECVARPLLVDRRLREWYAWDERIHGALRQRIEQQLRAGRLDGSSVEMPLDAASEVVQAVARGLSVGGLSSVQETAAFFYVVSRPDARRVRVVYWWKEPLESWLDRQGPELDRSPAVAVGAYRLRPMAPPSCMPDRWIPTPATPQARDGHTAVWTGTEMIVFGGLFSPHFNGRYNPATNTWVPLQVAGQPSPRTGHTAVWTGTEMIVWGGWGGSLPGNVLNTGGRYNPITDTWVPTSIGPGVPQARTDHTAVWTGTEMIVWGGCTSAGCLFNVLNTGARYRPDTDTWTPVSTASAPAPRHLHTAVWTGTEMIVWGGIQGNTRLNSGGRYNPSTDTWLPTSTVGAPEARDSHTAVWTGTEMIVWGGCAATSGCFVPVSTGGRYNPSTDTWLPTSTVGAPEGRRYHTAVWTGTEMVVWGGCVDNQCTSHRSSGGRYNPTADSWTPTSMVNAPTARSQHTAVWTGQEMLIWGGCTSGECQVELSTGGRYDPASDSWVPINPTDAPAGRAGHTAVWTGAEVIVWGGVNPQNPNTYEFTGGRWVPALNAWVPTAFPGSVSGRGHHTAVWTGTEMVVWGGLIVGGIISNSGGRYNPMTDTWSGTTTTNAPAPRYFHTAVWTGDRMVVWGGFDGSAALSTGGQYNPATDTWAGMTDAGAPAPRYFHTAVWTGDRMVVWGGFDGLGPLQTGGVYRPDVDQWTATSTLGAPSPRYLHTAVWTGTEMLVWGGRDAGSLLQTGGRYRPDTNTWSGVTTIDAPAPRQRAVAVWTGTEMLVWSGCLDLNCNTAAQDGGRWDALTDTWQPMSPLGAPAPRYAATAVWTGQQMMVWGGWGCLDPTFCGTALKTGGLYCGSFPTFLLNCSPSQLQGYRGDTLQVTCTLQSLSGFQGPVTMSCQDVPTGVTCQFSPNPVTLPPNGSVDTTLTLQVGPSVPFGTHSLEVVGTGQSITQTTPLQLQILKGPRFIGPPVPSGP